MSSKLHGKFKEMMLTTQASANQLPLPSPHKHLFPFSPCLSGGSGNPNSSSALKSHSGPPKLFIQDVHTEAYQESSLCWNPLGDFSYVHMHCKKKRKKRSFKQHTDKKLKIAPNSHYLEVSTTNVCDKCPTHTPLFYTNGITLSLLFFIFSRHH